MGPAAAYARDTRAALEREAVDALASDYLLFGPPIAAERAGVPRLCWSTRTFTSFPSPESPPQVPTSLPAQSQSSAGRGTPRSATRLWPCSTAGWKPVNRARTDYGLVPLRQRI